MIRKILTSVAVAALLATALPAQERPWTVGVDYGLNLANDCLWCFDNPTVVAHSANANVTYRWKRWLGLTAHLSTTRLQYWRNSYVIESELTGNLQSALQHNAFRTVSLSVGPQLGLRVGQGDLTAEFRVGVHRTDANTHIALGEDAEYDIAYSGYFSGYTAGRVAYTYWPMERFGVTLGVEAANAVRRVRSPFFDVFATPQPLRDLYTEAEVEALGILAPRIEGPVVINLVLGVQYRL